LRFSFRPSGRLWRRQEAGSGRQLQRNSTPLGLKSGWRLADVTLPVQSLSSSWSWRRCDQPSAVSRCCCSRRMSQHIGLCTFECAPAATAATSALGMRPNAVQSAGRLRNRIALQQEKILKARRRPCAQLRAASWPIFGIQVGRLANCRLDFALKCIRMSILKFGHEWGRNSRPNYGQVLTG
jgi:hypothetical protein